MLQLIQQGLDKPSLTELISLSDQLFSSKPAIYGALLCIFRALDQEYDYNGWIDQGRYASINALLRQPLVDLVNSTGQSGASILLRLDIVMDAFHQLS
jgi:hypothetical protein